MRRVAAQLEHLKVFVVAPDDVSDERVRLVGVVDRVNRALAARGVAIDLWHWRKDLVAGLHADGPAALLAEPLSQADLVLAVLWNQMGGALDDPSAALGSAVSRWKTEGRPNVLLFHCGRPATLSKAAKRESIGVDEVVEALQEIAMVNTYEAAEDFATLAFDALFAHGQNAAEPAPTSPLAPPNSAPPNLAAYLQRVRAQCDHVELTGWVESKRGAPTLTLEDVYVSLSATRFPNQPGRHLGVSSFGGGKVGSTLQSISPANADTMLDEGPDGEALAFPVGAHRDAEASVRAVAEALRDPKHAKKLGKRIDAALAALGLRPDTAAERTRVIASAQARFVDLEDELELDHVRRVLETEPLEAVLRRSNHVLIEGDPGTGKTTTLKHVAVALARAREGHSEAAVEMGFEARPTFPLPIFAPLSELAGWLAEQPNAKPHLARGADLRAFLEQAHGPWVGPALEAGEAVVLLDGLDEIMDDGWRKAVAHAVRDFLAEHSTSRFLVTSRPAGLTDAVRHQLLTLGRLGHARVERLGPGERRRFVRAWYRALVPDETRARTKADDLIQRIRGNPRLAELVDTPILLTAVAVVHHNGGRLPERRADLYEQCVQALAGRIDEVRGVPSLLEHDRRIQVLCKLAFERHLQGNSGRNLERGDLIARAGEQLAAQRKGQGQPEPEETERRRSGLELMERSGLLVHAGEAHYAFRHLTFQEFLGARWLATHEPHPEDVLGARLHEPWWREAILLHLGFTAKDGPSEALKRIKVLIERAEQRTKLSERAAAFSTLARAVLDLRQYPGGDAFREPAKVLEPHFVALIEDASQPGTLEDRVAMGDALGRFGDPRLSETRRWIDVPPGRFFRGAPDDDRDALSWERPAGWVTLTRPYRIQRWPVTVGELTPFVDAGHAERRWWSKEGWAWREREEVSAPGGWPAQRDATNMPATGVSWWEAEAYCRWLTAQGRWPGWQVRLPTEAEWERAARGAESDPEAKRRYPWGNDWSVARALSRAGKLGRPAPVGLFPTGHGPEGIWDAAGNVWEWCLDGTELTKDFEPQSYPHATARDPAGLSAASLRVIRGGAWLDDPRGLRVSCRSGLDPGDRAVDLGFRVLASPGRSPLDP